MFLYLTYSLSLSLFFPISFPSFFPCSVSIRNLGHCWTITFSYAKTLRSWFFLMFFSLSFGNVVLFFFFVCFGVFCGGVHCRCGLLPLCLWCGRGVGFFSYTWLLLCHVRSGHSHAPHADCVLALINWSSTEEKSACFPLAHSPTSNLLILWSSDPTASLTNKINTKKKEISITC